VLHPALRVLTFASVVLAASHGAIAGSIGSEAAACAALKRAAITYHLSRHDLKGRYYCEPNGKNASYFLLGLRYRVTPDESLGSNLIGWFAVRVSDGRVFDWDITEQVASPLEPRSVLRK
jgi:hypothetical protein